MLRGSIEIAQRSRVSGWIYSSAEPVRDKLILAFIGPRCVGAGKVDRFRKDLLEAKLGDGYCGYDFPIVLQDQESLGAVVIRLQNADAALIQATSRMVGPEDGDFSGAQDLGAVPSASVAWMQDRGWLDQPEFDFLKAIHNIGAYERGLRTPRRSGGEEQAPLNPQTVATDLMAIYALCEIDIGHAALKGLSELAGETSPLHQGGISLLALWSSERGRVCVDERSHLSAPPAGGNVLDAPPSGGIEYHFGPDRLLFLHRNVVFSPLGPAPAAGIIVFTGSQRASASRLQSRAA